MAKIVIDAEGGDYAPYEAVKAAIQELGLDIEAQYITDMKAIASYGVMRMPAIVINEKVVVMGKVYTAKEVMQFLKTTGGM